MIHKLQPAGNLLRGPAQSYQREDLCTHGRPFRKTHKPPSSSGKRGLGSKACVIVQTRTASHRCDGRITSHLPRNRRPGSTKRRGNPSLSVTEIQMMLKNVFLCLRPAGFGNVGAVIAADAKHVLSWPGDRGNQRHLRQVLAMEWQVIGPHGGQDGVAGIADRGTALNQIQYGMGNGQFG